jgi:hypothetical protein
MHTSLTADQSAWLLTGRIRERLPFFFLRYGDGAMECMRGDSGQTCDGEGYSPTLGLALLRVWESVKHGENVYLGDWLSATFDDSKPDTRYATLYRALVGSVPRNWLHFEALLLMRESAPLVDFYRAVQDDPRRKLYMGPATHAGAALMLRAEFLDVPMGGLFHWADALGEYLAQNDFEILLYGAGMAGNIPVARCWERFPERTYIHLGSALDPLFDRRTRRQQIQPARARYMFRHLLNREVPIAV